MAANRTLLRESTQVEWPWAVRSRAVAPYAVVASVVVATYARFLGTDFVTTDVWPLLASSRVSSPADLVELFGRPIMAGSTFATRIGEHYRPLVSVSFSLDYALWGLNSVGYNATNLVLHLANSLGVLALARRLGLWRSAAALAALVFALHPVMAAAVPGIARRQDALAGLFLLPALFLVAQETPGTWRLATAGGLFLVAVLSKEVALAGIPVAAILPLSRAAARGARIEPSTLRRLVLPPLLTCGGFGLLAFAARLVVLRGLGGYFGVASAITDISTEAYGRVFDGYIGFLLWPVPDLNLFSLLVGGLVGACVALAAPRWPRPELVTLLVAAGWLLSFCLLYMVLKLLGESAWYMYLPVAGWGLALAAVIQVCVRRLRCSGALDRPTALLGACAAILVAASIWWSPLVTSYPSWTDGGQLVHTFVEGARACFEQVPPDSVVVTDDLPSAVTYLDRGSHLVGVTLLEDYSVQAMADLFAPGKHLTIKSNSGTIMREPSPTARTACAARADGWHLSVVGVR